MRQVELVKISEYPDECELCGKETDDIYVGSIEFYDSEKEAFYGHQLFLCRKHLIKLRWFCLRHWIQLRKDNMTVEILWGGFSLNPFGSIDDES